MLGPELYANFSALKPWKQRQLLRLATQQPPTPTADSAASAAPRADGDCTLAALLADGHLNGLENLDLEDNRELGDAGAAAIAGALSAERLPALKELDLSGTGMGDAGARALAGALGGAPELETLIVGKNAFGPAAEEELKAACARRGVAAMAGPFDAL